MPMERMISCKRFLVDGVESGQLDHVAAAPGSSQPDRQRTQGALETESQRASA